MDFSRRDAFCPCSRPSPRLKKKANFVLLAKEKLLLEQAPITVIPSLCNSMLYSYLRNCTIVLGRSKTHWSP